MDLRLLAAFAAGAAVGSLTTWYFLKKRYDEENQDIRDTYREKERQLIEKDFPSQGAHIPNVDKKVPLSQYYNEKILQAGYTPYNSSPWPDTEHPSEDPAEAETREYDEKLQIITEEEFVSEAVDFEKSELVYYSGDGILASAENDETLDINYTITDVGLDALKKAEYGDYIYVRNISLHVDYEIHKLEGSYKQLVLNEYD